MLLDDFEPEMTTAEVRQVFDRLKEELVPLIAAVRDSADAVDGALAHGPFPIERQRAAVRRHPDAARLRRRRRGGSTRRPTRSRRARASRTSGSRRGTSRTPHGRVRGIHEFGHGLYEHGSAPELDRTPLCGGVSLGLHESQSRLWENLVGRSRPFWRRFFAGLQDAFPEVLGSADAESFYRAVNTMQPSLIRVEADEVTYNLHVILRFELEQELLAGRIALADLPEAWNARMDEYLGIEVPDDADGVLQDVHWSGGIFGYFPTYALGNVMSVQIWEAVRRDLADIDDQIEAGDFASLREWLRERLHRHGRKFTPQETLERCAGSRIDPEPYLGYLRTKVADVYGVAA